VSGRVIGRRVRRIAVVRGNTLCGTVALGTTLHRAISRDSALLEDFQRSNIPQKAVSRVNILRNAAARNALCSIMIRGNTVNRDILYGSAQRNVVPRRTVVCSAVLSSADRRHTILRDNLTG
jgi:hypothetical protein